MNIGTVWKRRPYAIEVHGCETDGRGYFIGVEIVIGFSCSLLFSLAFKAPYVCNIVFVSDPQLV